MNNIEKYTDKDWEKVASLLSGETTYSSDDLAGFREEDHFGIEKQWKDMGKTGNDRKIDVDKAWISIYSRIEENGLLSKEVTIEKRFRIQTIIGIAASLLIIVGFGLTMFYLNSTGVLTGKIVVSANSGERNKEVSLPDGSKVFLNRNSELSYYKKQEKSSRNVILKGEAFFEIKRDLSKPFIIDAGKASVTVLGTSFSVLTNNSKNAVEVFVKTGSVMLSDSSGNQNLVLEPGYIGTMDSKSSAKEVNKNPNYLSWNTDLFVYEKQTLDVVFSDLKKVYNIDVIADNPEILNNPLTATYEKEPEETIIRLLCSTFTLSYKKDGAVYHLSKK
jgi:ferric-dicitrate binding protein FerR (iron transport regulator)